MTTANQLKKASAFIALVNLFLSFKLDEYVSTDKARELFVESGVLDNYHQILLLRLHLLWLCLFNQASMYRGALKEVDMNTTIARPSRAQPKRAITDKEGAKGPGRPQMLS